MKVVINTCYSEFTIKPEIAKKCGFYKNNAPYYDDENYRTNEKLIELIESGVDCSGDEYSNLIVVEIPDEATDWLIEDYDGAESVYYVLDDKVYKAKMPEL